MEAVYELAKSPPTHDFVNWLARAEYLRRQYNDGILAAARAVKAKLQADWGFRR